MRFIFVTNPIHFFLVFLGGGGKKTSKSEVKKHVFQFFHHNTRNTQFFLVCFWEGEKNPNVMSKNMRFIFCHHHIPFFPRLFFWEEQK
jgi:hypothetical protein